MPVMTKILGIIIALSVGFLLLGVLVFPMLAPAYNFCQVPQWRPDSDGTYTNCTQRFCDSWNTSIITAGSTYSGCGITANVENTESSRYCLNCNTRGGYFTTNQALMLIILVIGIIGIGLRFMPRFSQ